MKQTHFILALCFLTFISCQNKDSASNEPSQTISLNPTVLNMTEGDMSIITPTTTATSIQWTSSNTEVAEVSQGAVVAMGIGTAVITASTGDHSATCTVFVTGKEGQTITLSPTTLSLKKGDTYQLVYRSLSESLPLTFSSSADTVATVSETGLVTALKGGLANITLTNGAETCVTEVLVEHNWSDYELVWAEEFEGTSLDLNTWTIEVNGSGGGNSEKQYYTDRTDNIRVKDGNLEIQLRKETYGNKSYTSGRINSKEKKAFKYGKIEARIKVPSGGGTWPAFWMMGNDYSKRGWPQCGEIDIMEHIGNQPSMVSFALHTVKQNGDRGNNWNSKIYPGEVENEYHTYGIEWVEEESAGLDCIWFTYDGERKAVKSEDSAHKNDNSYWPFNKEFFIILNLAVGGKMGGEIDDSMFDHDVIMYVDWVRVYQRHEIE